MRVKVGRKKEREVMRRTEEGRERERAGGGGALKSKMRKKTREREKINACFIC